jgi:hypothetical protein
MKLCKVLVGKMEVRDRLGNVGAIRRIIVKKNMCLCKGIEFVFPYRTDLDFVTLAKKSIIARLVTEYRA